MNLPIFYFISTVAQYGPKTEMLDSFISFFLLLFAMVLLGLFTIWILIAVLWIDISTARLKTKRKFANVSARLSPVFSVAMILMAGFMFWEIAIPLDDGIPGKAIFFLILYCLVGPIIGVVTTFFSFRFRKRMYE